MSCINFIPSDVIEAILLRLPAKSLGRLKSVSKTWNSLISDPLFIKAHTHQLLHQPKPTKKLLAISKTTRSFYSIDLTIDNDINGIPSTTAKEKTIYHLKTHRKRTSPMSWRHILGSCNGLVLARDVNGFMFLINPTTHELWKLPVTPIAPGRPSVYYGFGYDSSSDDYKVLSVSVRSSYEPSISYNFTFSIYSLRNNSWRELPNTPHHIYHDASFALVNGNCHWLMDSSSPIIAFSFVDELFSEIKPPDSILNCDRVSALVEIGGRLGVYLYLKTGDYELWVMQEYGDAKSWTMVFSHARYMRSMCFLEGSDRDIVFHNVDGVSLLNIDDGRCRNVRIVGDPSRFFIQDSFGESIESIKRIIKTPLH